MILSDADIVRKLNAGVLKIEPFNNQNLKPSSYDLCLGDQFLVFQPGHYSHIDVKDRMEDLTELVEVDDYFMLHPNQFVIGTTIEYFEFPGDVVGRLDGKSSLGRLGLLIHSTAGFFDAGFSGQATLELSNIAPLPIKIYPGMPIGQMSFWYMSSMAMRPYGEDPKSKYQDQRGPTASKYYLNFEKGDQDA